MSSLMVWLAVLSVIGSALLASLFLALSTVARAAVDDIATTKNDPARARRIARIFDDTTSHARAVGLLKVLCDLVTVVSLLYWISSLRGSPAPEWSDAVIAVLGGVVVLWVFTVAIPTSVAAHAGPRLLYGRSFMLRGLEVAASPLHGVASFIDEVIRRLSGAPRKDEHEQAQAEILSVIEESATSGAIGEREKEMIEAVVQFRDLTVLQVMTPRTDIEAMELTNDLGAVIRTIRQIGHSRIPVYEDSLDHIVGIFYVKDLMHWLAGESPVAGKPGGPSRAFDLRSILRPAYAVPETKTVRELLTELMTKKVHIAIVVDEYGGTSGLVTIEDIVEEIIGDIRDEYEAPLTETPDVVLKLENRSAELDAAARILDVNGAIEPLGVQIPESEDYDTVGGFIVTNLGRIPTKGETFQHDSMLFTILEAKPTRVVKVSMAVKDGSAEADRPPVAAGARH